MIYKELPYKDFEGRDRKKTFFFSLSQTEFTILNNRFEGGIEGYIKRIIEDHDEEKLIDVIMLFVVEGYGIRESSDDFIKEDKEGRKLGNRFKCSEACDNLITELLQKDNDIWAFIIGMLPASVQEKVKAKLEIEGASFTDDDGTVVPLHLPEEKT